MVMQADEPPEPKERPVEAIAYLCYLFNWHPNCTIVPCWVGWPAVWCPEHHCLAHIDLVGKHITPEASYE